MKKQVFVFLALSSLSTALWATPPVIEPAMLTVPAGQFLMGGDGGPSTAADTHPVEGPAHTVRIEAFNLAKYEVTVREFRQFVEATGHETRDQCWRIAKNDWGMEVADGRWNTPAYAPSDYHPVMCVSWADAKAYVEWLSAQTGKTYRLPSEAEWEYAARAGSDASYPFGDDPTELCRYGNVGDRNSKAALLRDHGITRKAFVDCDDGAEYTTVVGMYEPNAFGLHDMVGNVAEWVEDCQHIDYSGAPDDGSAWTRDCDTSRGTMLIRRGSSYHAGSDNSRSRWRGHGGKENSSSLGEGFRIAQDIQADPDFSCSRASSSACSMPARDNPFMTELAKAQQIERKRRGK